MCGADKDLSATMFGFVSRFATTMTYGLSSMVVAALIGLLIILQVRTEAAVLSVVGVLPIGFAVAAGIVASINPCGFFMLPGYVAYQLGTREVGYGELSPLDRVLRAMVVGAMVTLGFVLVFATVGVGVAAGGVFFGRFFPFLGLAVGVLMIGFGAYLLITRRYVGVLRASRVQVTPRRNAGNAFVFGVGYAIGSFSCSLPVFLVVVGSSLGTESFLASFSQFVGFAAGMGCVVIAVTIGAAIVRDAVWRFLRGAVPYVQQTSSLFLVGVGGYLVYYWVFFAGLNL